MFQFLYGVALVGDFMRSHLGGMSADCAAGANAVPAATVVGIIMLTSAVLFYVTLYYLVDSAKYFRKSHVWVTAGVLMFFNFVVAFAWIASDIYNHNVCSLNPIGLKDAFGFAVLNAFWSFVAFAILTSIPVFRAKSKNLANTTLLKP